MLTKEFAAVENGTISAGQIQRDAMGNIVAGEWFHPMHKNQKRVPQFSANTSPS